MSSSKTIDERRQQRDELQAAVDKMKVDRKALKKSIATLEHHVLKLEIGEKGSLYRLAKLIDSTEDMEILKQQMKGIVENIGTLFSDSADFQASLHNYLCEAVKILNETDEKRPQEGRKLFKEKLDEAKAKLKEDKAKGPSGI